MTERVNSTLRSSRTIPSLFTNPINRHDREESRRSHELLVRGFEGVGNFCFPDHSDSLDSGIEWGIDIDFFGKIRKRRVHRRVNTWQHVNKCPFICMTLPTHISAIRMCNVTGFSLAFGLCSALDTLVSQAYGAKLYRLMGLHSQRAIVIISVSAIPVTFLWMQTGYILEHILMIEKDTASLAGYWSETIAIGLWPSLVFEILRKFLQGQQIIWPVSDLDTIL